ncbi:MAG TPA: hypothetical protein VF043_39095 [Ktedonobacteraceae bacterium]
MEQTEIPAELTIHHLKKGLWEDGSHSAVICKLDDPRAGGPGHAVQPRPDDQARQLCHERLLRLLVDAGFADVDQDPPAADVLAQEHRPPVLIRLRERPADLLDAHDGVLHPILVRGHGAVPPLV